MFKFGIILTYFFTLIYCKDLNYDDDWSVDDHRLFPALPIAAPFSEDELCRNDSRLLISSLKNKTTWAVKMWDASAKTESGLLHGNTYYLGQFDECMSVEQPIQSQFCLVTVKVNSNASEESSDMFHLDHYLKLNVWEEIRKSERDNITWSLCGPASCTPEELLKSVRRHLNIINAKHDNLNYAADIESDFQCIRQKAKEYSPAEIAFWAFITLTLLTIIISSAIDFIIDIKSNGRLPTRALMCFSLKRNFKTLIKEENYSKKKSDPLRIFNFIRVFSTYVVVCFHRPMMLYQYPLYNYQQIDELKDSFAILLASQVHLVIDIFFFASGVLTYNSLWGKREKIKQNFFRYIISRWIRLAFPYYFLIWFVAEAPLRLGSGPIWEKHVLQQSDFCKKSWWTNILFLNNYVNVDDWCLLHSWFIPVVFHLFLVNLVVMIIIAKHEKLGLYLIAVLFFVSNIIPGIVTYVYQINPYSLENLAKNLLEINHLPMWKQLYAPTHARAGNYILGLIVAYVVIKMEQLQKKLSPRLEVLGYLLFVVFAFGPPLYVSIYPKSYDNNILSALLAIVRRTSFGFSLSIFVLINGFGKHFKLKDLLEHRVWALLSRTIYSIYLWGFYIQQYFLLMIRVPRYFSFLDTIITGIGEMFVTIIICSILYLIFELPFQKLFDELFIFKRKTPQTDGDKKVTEVYSQEVFDSESNNRFPNSFERKF